MMDVDELLAAIEETERNAEEAKQMRWVFDTNRRNGRTVLEGFFTRHSPAAALRRCAADRRLLKRLVEVSDPQYLKYSPGVEVLVEFTLSQMASGYGISVEEETTGE